MSTSLAEVIRDSRVVLTVGAGGVGKTTVAAALGLRTAVEGRSALVCTIDPARRLANSLGLAELGNAEAQITDEQLRASGLQAKAPLFAMMLDMKQTWDDLIERYAPPDKRQKILESRFYQALSTRLAGSQEYIALEKLWQLRNQRSYDTIVLDTPPTAHALDFLDAPNRVLDFLDNEAARWLLSPALAAGKVGLKLMNLGGSYVAKTLSKITGTDTLAELAAFMSAMSGMNEGFRERTQQVRELLSDPKTAFLLVTIPAPERLDEVLHFHRLLLQNEMRVAAIVVNRVHAPASPEAWEAARALPSPLRKKAELTLEEHAVLAEQDAAGIELLRRECPGCALIEIPRFDLDVHDLRALWTTSEYLLGDRVLSGPPDSRACLPSGRAGAGR